MAILDRNTLRRQAESRLEAAPNGGRLALIFVCVTAALFLAASIVSMVLDGQIAGTGGLGGMQLRSTLSDFLDHLCEKDFAAAAETVCFLSEEDGSVLQSDSALRALWAKRMQDLGTGVSNTYLKSYEDLSVRKEKGEMIVTASLQVMRQGFPDTLYQNTPHRIFVVYNDGEWKFVGISDAELQTDFEKCISGRISSSPSEVAP
jgi:hypothetical protein